MDKNSNHKGELEQNCLNDVKAVCFANCYGSDASKISYSNVVQYGFRYDATGPSLLQENFEDYEPIAKLLATADNTDIKTKETNFPDFKCENGLIEHFQVSATKTTSSGAKSMQARGDANRKLDNIIKEDGANGELKKHYEETYQMPAQTFEYFVDSFKRSWENHIEKLDKYEGNKECVCFLIESDCFGLIMELHEEMDFELGVTTGHIVENYLDNRKEHFQTIMLGRCKELLEYIYEYKDKVQYVIFKSSQSIELIKTDRAAYIASLLKKYTYHCAIVTESVNRIRLM